MTPSGWIRRGEVRLALYQGGAHGPPLVFQHGLCGDVGQVAEAMAGMGGQRWHCMECRGHGASDRGPASIAAFADDLAAMIDGMGGPVILGGISMGAALATRLAVIRRDLVQALVLVRPAWVAEAGPENMAPNAEMGALLGRMPGPQAGKAFAAGATAARLARVSPDNMVSLMGFAGRNPQDDTATLLTAIAADGPGITRDDLRALRMPALICATDKDAIHPVAHAVALGAMIPGARLAMLPPKGDDKPGFLAALADAMTTFIKELPHAAPAP